MTHYHHHLQTTNYVNTLALAIAIIQNGVILGPGVLHGLQDVKLQITKLGHHALGFFFALADADETK